MTDTKNIMIVGVGGQGTRLASRIISSVVIKSGFDVKTSEVHGMSQRGGSVVTYVKYGEKVYSPIIGKGESDVILAFEELEAYRALPYLKIGGSLIVNTQKINPMPVITGAAEYPENIIEKMKANDSVNIIPLNALEFAEKANNPKASNVVLVGVMAKRTNIPHDKWIEAIKETTKPQFVDANIKAFEMGYNF